MINIFFVTEENLFYKPRGSKTKHYIADENTTKLNTSIGQKMVKQNHLDYQISWINQILWKRENRY